MDELIEALNRRCDEQVFDTGWYLKNLQTGEEAGRKSNTIYPSGSTRKIAILMTALRAVHAGVISMDQPLQIQEKYQNTRSGCFQHLTPGVEVPLRDMLVMMIIVSDNVSTGTIADLLGLDVINEFSQSVGMTGTAHRTGMPLNDLPWDHPVEMVNTTTPRDVGQLLDLILQGSQNVEVAETLGCSAEQCQLALDILSWQKLRDKIPYLLPRETRVGCKTGLGIRNINDAGIVYDLSGEPCYILTAYTDFPQPEQPDGLPWQAVGAIHIQHLSRMCWDALAG